MVRVHDNTRLRDDCNPPICARSKHILARFLGRRGFVGSGVVGDVPRAGVEILLRGRRLPWSTIQEVRTPDDRRKPAATAKPAPELRLSGCSCGGSK